MAGMAMDDRAKLTGGIVVTLVAIGLLHWFVYQENHKKFEEAKARFNQVQQELNNVKTGNRQQLESYKKITQEASTRIQEISKQLSVGYRAVLTPVPPEPPPDPNAFDQWNAQRKARLQQQTEVLRAELRKVLAMRDQTPKLNFLGVVPPSNPNRPIDRQDIGWFIPNQLPEALANNPQQLVDLLRNMQAIQKTIALMPETSTAELAQQYSRYSPLLANLGVPVGQYPNAGVYPFLAYQWRLGYWVPLYNLIGYTDLVVRSLPEGSGLAYADIEKLLFLIPGAEQLGVAIRYPENEREMFSSVKQLMMLQDLIRRAEPYDIVSVSKVRLIEYYLFKEGGVIPSEYVYPEAGAVPGRSGAQGLSSEMTPLIEPFLDRAQVDFEGRMVAILTPIEFVFRATYDNAMKYLYHLAHCERAYELHALSFSINETERDPLVRVSATVYGFAFIKDVSKPIGAPKEEKKQ